uniref:hypothetical protein n=1 Tax=Priestia megaterium TaxID=1404 RepID=UPI001F27749D
GGVSRNIWAWREIVVWCILIDVMGEMKDKMELLFKDMLIRCKVRMLIVLRGREWKGDGG